MTTTVPAAEMIAALETSEAPTPEEIAAARATLAAELAAIEAKVFEPIAARPRAADDLATLRYLTDRFAHASFDRDLAAAHRTALQDSPGLAALCRTSEILADCAERAAIVNPHVAAGVAIRRYQVALCSHLVEGTDAPSDARAFLATVDLEPRLDALQHRAEERAAAAAAAAEEERKAAARAALDRALAAEQTAAAAAEEARRAADAADRAHHQTRAAVLREKLRLCGRDVLRTGHEVFDVAPLIGVASQLSPFDVNRFTAALDRIEAP